ncbi:MAG TPA: DNA (cytosine-5-)-methyltransferase, partial [Bacillota bacterium]|nr:DNA (cytosine-5-)-methyltransferase [Bacillota bacterium]
YRQGAINKMTTNICSFFLDKCVELGDEIALVLPKAVLNIPEFATTRAYLSRCRVSSILDFGEIGFKGVLVETIALIVSTVSKPLYTTVYSMTHNLCETKKQSYICDDSLPYWVIYRNELFDSVAAKMQFDVFSVFRDRQITNGKLHKQGDLRILKSRNLDDRGKSIVSIPGYDAYMQTSEAANLAVYRFMNCNNIYITPNMTYKPRVMLKPTGTLVNGSVAILIPKEGIKPTNEQLEYFSSDEYRKFYQIARNYQTRSLNVDACSVYFFGLLKEGEFKCRG